jgi:4-amino-4-deoxy-L-arabinose transferase-like glycosyltransferase
MSSKILWIVILALTLRLAWMFYATPVPLGDSKSYRDAAANILDHGQIGYPQPSAYRLPVYPVFIAGIMVVSRSTLWLGFSSVLLSTTLVYLMYRLVLQGTAREGIALLGALFCAVNPTFILSSSLLSSENLFSVLMMLSLLTVVGLGVPIVRRSVICGVLVGLSVLTRGEGVFYLPAVLLSGMLCGLSRRERCIAATVPALVAIICVLPWCIRNYCMEERVVGLSTTGGLNAYFAHNPDYYGWQSVVGTPLEGLSEVEQNKQGRILALKNIGEGGVAGLLKNVGHGTVELYLTTADYALNWSLRKTRSDSAGPYPMNDSRSTKWFRASLLLYYLLLAGAIASLFFLRKYPVRLWSMLLGVILMNWICYAWVFWGYARYRYVSEVLFCALSAIAVAEIFRLLKPSGNPHF